MKILSAQKGGGGKGRIVGHGKIYQTSADGREGNLDLVHGNLAPQRLLHLADQIIFIAPNQEVDVQHRQNQNATHGQHHSADDPFTHVTFPADTPLFPAAPAPTALASALTAPSVAPSRVAFPVFSAPVALAYPLIYLSRVPLVRIAALDAPRRGAAEAVAKVPVWLSLRTTSL